MKAIISFANSRGNYMKSLERLKNSINYYDKNPFLGFIGEDSIGSPLHLENPYAFKIYAFKKARELGYTKILYLDSSIFAVNPLDKLWEVLDEDGYFMQEAGHLVGRWCNERTLEYFSLSREAAMDIMMYGNAGLLALDFENEKANNFFQLWEKSMLEGQFIGSWDDHRHDMTCGSIIANRLQMKLQSGNKWMIYTSDEAAVSEDIIFHASGM